MRFTKSQLRQIIQEELKESKDYFSMGEKVVKFIEQEFGINKNQAPSFLRFVATHVVPGRWPAAALLDDDD